MYATVNFRMQIVENRGLIIEVVDDTGTVRERHIDDTYAGQSTAPLGSIIKGILKGILKDAESAVTRRGVRQQANT